MTRSTAPPLGHYIATEGQHVLTQEGAPIYQSETKKPQHDAEQDARYNLHLCQQVCVDTVCLCVYINMQCLGEESDRIQNKLNSGNYPTEGVFTFNLLH